MRLKPRKSKRKPAESYPTYREARQNRRQFLAILGKGLLAAPLLALTRCDGPGKEEWVTGGVPEPPDLNPEDAVIPGDMPIDIQTNPPEAQYPDYELMGITDAPDLKEKDFPPLEGDMPAPDIVPQNPDVVDPPQEDVQEQDWVLGGVAPADSW